MSAGMELLGFSETVQDFRRMKEWAGDDDVVYVVGTNVEYAAFVEFGTSKMKAQPYLRPAARQVARPVQAVRGRVVAVRGRPTRIVRRCQTAPDARATRGCGGFS